MPMGRWERTGIRDLTFSNWHRQIHGDPLRMVDVDGLEFCRKCKQPLALIETGLDYGQDSKWTGALAGLARRAGVPAFCLLYTKSGETCAVDHRGACQRLGCSHGIARFRARRIEPAPNPFAIMPPGAVRGFLVRMHVGHEATVCRAMEGEP
jgi:hypothetical protein